MNCVFQGRPIAHRGLWCGDKIPENSIGAFDRAIQRGYAIELDVQLLKDNTPIVIHDNNLYRLTGVRKSVNDLIVNDLSQFKLKGTNYSIPTLEEALQFINGRVPILVDIKYEKLNNNRIIHIGNILRKYKGEYIVQSLNVMTLKWLKQYEPQIKRGLIVTQFKNELFNPPHLFWKKLALKMVDVYAMTKPHIVACNVKGLPNKKIAKIRKKGVPILGWTIKDQVQFETYKPYIDNIIFEGFEPCADCRL